MPRPALTPKRPGALLAVLAVLATLLAAVPTLTAVAADVHDGTPQHVPGDPQAGHPVVAAGPEIRSAAAGPIRPASRPDTVALAARVAEEPRELISGVASWYGPGFAGRRTASGEIYDPSELVAAHRSLPFGTQVRVTNRDNGRSVVVRITDRGPYVGGRVIDLSAAAADAIGMRGTGTAPVTLEVR